MALLVAVWISVLGYALTYKGVRDWSGTPMSFREAITGQAGPSANSNSPSPNAPSGSAPSAPQSAPGGKPS